MPSGSPSVCWLSSLSTSLAPVHLENANSGSVSSLSGVHRVQLIFTCIPASIKVLTIVGLIILGLVIDLGGGPTHDRLGFRFWVFYFPLKYSSVNSILQHHPGPFVQFDNIGGSKGRFLGFWSVLINAAYAFVSFLSKKYFSCSLC